MKKELIKYLKENIQYALDYESLISKPKIESHGDFSLPLFILSKELKKSPQDIAKDMESKLMAKKFPEFLEKVVAMGPYINFYINKTKEAKEVLTSIAKGTIFDIKIENPQKILIEYPSPNTNKSLHIGHTRNMFLGNSITKIFKEVGHKVIKTNMNNDRGIAICKSMLGYEMFFANETPNSLNLKSDEFISKCYVKFEEESKKDDSLNQKAQDMLVLWEKGDKKTRKLWRKIMDYVFEGYNQTYKNYKIGNYDKQYFESEIYDKGKEIVLDALKNKVKGFEKEEDEAIMCDLEDVNLGKKYLLRGDGTALYMTQDLYLAYTKEKEFNPHKSVFIVGKDQEYHFYVLFEILQRLGFGGNDKNFHFSYGYVFNKDGKKFASRKGEVVGADWMLDLVVQKAKENLLIKEITKNLTEKELQRRASIIGYSALCFSILKINPKDDIKFDVDKALAFEGETGPYVQYTYARIQSILAKANDIFKVDIDFDLFNNKESSLIKALKEYREVILEATNKYKPSHLANYLIRICQLFNEFYQNSPILKEKKNIQEARLLLCYCTARIIKKGLELLDIETLEEM